MPLYEYRCQKCGEEFEKVVRFSEADQAHECPACGSLDTRKKVSAFASGGCSSSGDSCGSSGHFT